MLIPVTQLLYMLCHVQFVECVLHDSPVCPRHLPLQPVNWSPWPGGERQNTLNVS